MTAVDLVDTDDALTQDVAAALREIRYQADGYLREARTWDLPAWP